MKHNLKRASQVLASIFGVMTLGGAQYVVAQDIDTCAVNGKNGSVVIIVCPPGLDRQKWQRVAETACAKVKACSAWIWDDPKKAPKSTPAVATKIAKKDVLTAIAIWDNGTRKLMTIERVKKSP